ncbi:hypothetical protein FA13DRAFT_986298 [Coprinellus micaceus]|uniref:Uncharacterized protein n=1 Tax=Coprinellus micaceus TaxID=71717 RepID=A0A4Y7T0C3_COPMI|nr:hypothetical protein FA13DRAFT_986298 [Coprinellus micaceus]
MIRLSTTSICPCRRVYSSLTPNAGRVDHDLPDCVSFCAARSAESCSWARNAEKSTTLPCCPAIALALWTIAPTLAFLGRLQLSG